MRMIARPEQLRLDLPCDAIAALCRQYGVVELSVFGSALRDDFRPDSDVDFMAVFVGGDYGPWMSRLTSFESDLSRLLGRKADVSPREAIEHSENYIRRRHILESAKAVYVA
jgi:predicted nucleotidyltransferase